MFSDRGCRVGADWPAAAHRSAWDWWQVSCSCRSWRCCGVRPRWHSRSVGAGGRIADLCRGDFRAARRVTVHRRDSIGGAACALSRLLRCGSGLICLSRPAEQSVRGACTADACAGRPARSAAGGKGDWISSHLHRSLGWHGAFGCQVFQPTVADARAHATAEGVSSRPLRRVGGSSWRYMRQRRQLCVGLRCVRPGAWASALRG